MIAKAEAKFLRISPKKVNQVMGLIRKEDALRAQSILHNLNKGPCKFLSKILNAAIANAKVKGFNVNQLFISKLVCNPGPSWKRYKAAAFGRASPIKKRCSHIKLELDLKSGE